MARFSSRLYLHVIGPSFELGGWQFRFEGCALFSLRDALTHEIVAQLPEALVVAALAHYVGAAALTRELLPRLPALPARRGPGDHDTGAPRLRGAETRRLRGRKGP